MVTYFLQTPGTKPHPLWCSLTYSQAFGLSCCEHDQPAAACSMKCTVDVIIALILPTVATIQASTSHAYSRQIVSWHIATSQLP